MQDDIAVDEAIAQMTEAGITRPILFKCQDRYWIKADAAAIPIIDPSCFDNCLEFLLMTFFMFNVEYPMI